jgi:hypothetical protein
VGWVATTLALPVAALGLGFVVERTWPMAARVVYVVCIGALLAAVLWNLVALASYN